MSMPYNLWTWRKGQWCIVASFKTYDDAKFSTHDPVFNPDTWTVAKQGTPKDQYMRDNAGVRHAPQNYVRLVQPPPPPPSPEKVVDHTARGSYDT